MTNANQDIRDLIQTSGLKMWEIAKKYGISDTNFCRLLRTDLSLYNKQKIKWIIVKLQKESKNEQSKMGSNEDIRELVRKNNLKLWQVAYRYGVADTTFSKLLRKEIAGPTKRRIIEIIDELVEERKTEIRGNEYVKN